MSRAGTARNAVTAALATVGVPVHTYPPQTVTPPCVVLLPARGDYVDPRGHVTLTVAAYATPAGGNQSGMQRLDDLIDAIHAGLFAGGLAPGPTSGPTGDPDTGWLIAETTTTVRISP